MIKRPRYQKPLSGMNSYSDQLVLTILEQAQEMERFCEVVAAIKVRASNREGRYLSSAEAIRLLEEYGVQTPEGPVRHRKTPSPRPQ
jgi:hypothetical protein